MAETKRQSNIELLRLLAMVGVIILHYNNAEIGGGFRYVTGGSVNEYVLVFLESIAICGVNLFVMISGYFLGRSQTRSIGKAASILIQVCIYSLLNGIILILLGRVGFRLKTLALFLVPQNWFITLYLVLFLISPLINRAIKGILSRKVIFGLLLLFSVIPTVLDIIYEVMGRDFNSLMTLGTNGSGRGYTIISFMLCYIIGVLLSERPLKKIKTGVLILILIVDIGVIFLWALWNRSTAWEYCNPLVILEAALFIELFLRINLGSNKVINYFARCALSVYLIHQYLIPYLRIGEYVQKNVFVMIFHIIVCCLLIIVVSFCVDWIYQLVTKRFNRWIKNKGVYTL